MGAAHAHDCFLVPLDLTTFVLKSKGGLPVLGYVQLELIEPIFQVVTELNKHPTQDIADVSQDTNVRGQVAVRWFDLLW